MTVEGGIAPVAAPAMTMEAPQPLELNTAPPPQQELNVQLVTPENTQALAILERADRTTANGIETALQSYVDQDIVEAEFTIDDDQAPAVEQPTPPVIHLEEPPAPTPPSQQEASINVNSQEATQKINDEITRRGANAGNAYDQLVYQFPEQAQQLADAGNEDAKAAIARRDELAKNPSQSTALETRPVAQEAPAEAQSGTELSRNLREIQTVLQQVDTSLEKININKNIPKEVREVTFSMADALKLIMILLINSIKDLDTEGKLAVAKAIVAEREPKKRKKIIKEIVEEQTASPQLETAPIPAQIKAPPEQRQLLLPAPDEPATALPEVMQKQALLLPPPAEGFEVPVLDLNATSSPALEAALSAAPTT